jgi:hypothetical protein
MKKQLEYTDSEMLVFKKAIGLLEPFKTFKTARNITYFQLTKTEEVIGENFNCCESSNCIKKVKKKLRKHYPRVHITEVFTYNDSDNDSIRFCNGCCLPMNEHLTWVEQEFEYFESNVFEKEDMIQVDNAFCITAIFYAQPSLDQFLNKKRILNYARLVISELEK